VALVARDDGGMDLKDENGCSPLSFAAAREWSVVSLLSGTLQ